MRERARLEKRITGYDTLVRELDENAELIELAEAEGDEDIAAEAEVVLVRLSKSAEKQQIESLLSGEADGNDCYLEVHAGAGGTNRKTGRRDVVAHVSAMGSSMATRLNG